MVPPGLAWLRLFSASTGLALDQGMVAEVFKTVNQLTYKVFIKWTEPIPMAHALQVWNLFQKWASTNNSTPSGRVEFQEYPDPLRKGVGIKGFVVEVHIRERLGHPKLNSP
jgi:hypothetical protein